VEGCENAKWKGSDHRVNEGVGSTSPSTESLPVPVQVHFTQGKGFSTAKGKDWKVKRS